MIAIVPERVVYGSGMEEERKKVKLAVEGGSSAVTWWRW
jgi:hypothetical protein